MKNSRRWLTLALGLAGMVAVLQCQNAELQETEIFLTVSGNVEGIEKVSLIARNRYVFDTGVGGRCENVQCSDEIVVPIAADRDISPSKDPVTLLLKPSAPIASEDDPSGFFIHARGLTANDVVLAAKGKILLFQSGERLEVAIEMDGETASCDTDADGFADCQCGLQLESGQVCDCDDSSFNINPFRTEECDDTEVDENCSGFPSNEGCPCTSDQVCTTLPEAQRQLAGIGKCTTGILTCVDGVLSDVCEGAGSPEPEIDGNLIDDDCDGDVDEAGVCSSGDQRRCLLGQIDTGGMGCARGETGTDCVASALAKGICTTGIQACEGGFWGECVNDVMPLPPGRGQWAGWRATTSATVWTTIVTASGMRSPATTPMGMRIPVAARAGRNSAPIFPPVVPRRRVPWIAGGPKKPSIATKTAMIFTRRPPRIAGKGWARAVAPRIWMKIVVATTIWAGTRSVYHRAVLTTAFLPR